MGGLIINPGSGDVGKEGEGWTNTHAQARVNAFEYYYKRLLEMGITDIKVTDTKEERDGRWLFKFEHTVTGKVIELEIDGIDNMDEYMKTHIFGTRTYWNGSSSSIIELEQFAADGFKPYCTFIKEDK